ncbi:hypothetical protein Lal_00026527 [Lupinus albus]|nr:hypothetical protein Lal_00026527 [Lupinus albus]
MTNLVLYGGMRKDPKVGGGVGFGSSNVANFGSSNVANFGSSNVASFGSSYVAWFSKIGFEEGSEIFNISSFTRILQYMRGSVFLILYLAYYVPRGYSGDHLLINLEKELHGLYNKVLKEEELLWFQKSREQWVHYGDRNTKYKTDFYGTPKASSNIEVGYHQTDFYTKPASSHTDFYKV